MFHISYFVIVVYSVFVCKLCTLIFLYILYIRTVVLSYCRTLIRRPTFQELSGKTKRPCIQAKPITFHECAREQSSHNPNACATNMPPARSQAASEATRVRV